MPGILPMKVIKVGNAAQSRIAQACDRCRSKKIRCDGIRPCCSQCASVGFECKTSDKLSRRAFPRGYTESLEDRVRALELEVRELKDLLDEKDEKIDMLSRIHSFSAPPRKSSSSLSPRTSAEVKAESESPKEEYIHVHTSASDGPRSQSATRGPSTASAFIDAFKSKLRDDGAPSAEIRPDLLSSRSRSSSTDTIAPSNASKIPPRLLSDQFINIYFQEWAPLLPILHRPTLLKFYEDFLADPDSFQSNKQAIAQLYLVFEIAALSSVSRIKQSTTSYEPQWRKALHAVSSTPSVSTLQGHILAQVYFLLKADYKYLARHRAIGVGLCHQLGLHQSQNASSLSTLESETRKRVFWSQYVLDKFIASVMGVPVLLRDNDVHTEYPADVDDENITDKGYLPTLPGELTKFSSSLAMFDVSRVLSKVMEELYQSSASYNLPLSKVRSLSEELESWSRSLPSHLRLQFSKDKPGLGVISSRSPLLSLMYFYVRTLIHRPVVCYGSGNNASASLMSIADSAKHIIQILDLLDERRLNYTLPISKTELLLTSGFGLLWQSVDLPSNSKLAKDNQKSISLLLGQLDRESTSSAGEFQKVVTSLISMDDPLKGELKCREAHINTHEARLLNPMPAPDPRHKSTKKQLQAIASRFSFGMKPPKVEEVSRRATVPKVSPPLGHSGRNFSQLSISSARSEPVLPVYSPQAAYQIDMSPRSSYSNAPSSQDLPNLDYLPLGDESMPPPPTAKPAAADPDWERILATMDSGQTNIYDGIYGGGDTDTFETFPNLFPMASNEQTWGAETWPPTNMGFQDKAPIAQSVLSYSEGSITSGEELSNLSNSSHLESVGDPFRGIAIPHAGEEYDYDAFDARLDV